jgi:CHASE2 domain-containing sensor protein
MTGKLAETLDADTLEAAKQARVVIVGMSRAQGEELHGLAKALATVLALPKVNQVPLTAQYGIWAVATITARGLVRQGRRRTLLKTVGLVFIAFVLSYLVFESTMLWCPPTIPVALLIGGGVLASAFGKRSPTPAPDAPSKALVES